MKRIVFLLCCFFVFASFTSENKPDNFSILGRWVSLDEGKGFREISFYEGNYVRLISSMQSMNSENERLKYAIDWDYDPYILSIFPEMEKGLEMQCYPSGNKMYAGLKIIDNNHIQIVWQSGVIGNSTFRNSKIITLTRQ